MFTLKIKNKGWDIPVKEFFSEDEAIEFVKDLDLYEYSYKIFDENGNLVVECDVKQGQTIHTRYENSHD